MIMVWRISSCFSPSLSQNCSWCQKSGLEENITTTIIANEESVSTQCLYILCDAFRLYLVVVWAYWLELTNFMVFTPLQHPQHVMIMKCITPSNDKKCLFIWERWCELKSGIFLCDICEDMINGVRWRHSVRFWWNPQYLYRYEWE